MRGRLVFLTLTMMCATVLGMTQVQAIAQPTRRAAQQSVALVPVRIDTTRYARLRNIFAPLATETPAVQLAPAVITPTPVATSTGLRLAAMVEDIQFQETTDTYTATEKEHFDTLLAGSFAKFPTRFVSQLERLTLKKSRTGSRGLAGASVMILRTGGVSDEELVAVSIHELGHVIDMGVVIGTGISGASSFMDGTDPVWNDDPSLRFYSISWNTDKERLSNDAADYVSGYAMSDPFEDFSETFAMYVLHGERFRTLTKTNGTLARKYVYVRDTIFGGLEFSGIDAISSTQPATLRPWDVTREPYSWAAFQQASFLF